MNSWMEIRARYRLRRAIWRTVKLIACIGIPWILLVGVVWLAF